MKARLNVVRLNSTQEFQLRCELTSTTDLRVFRRATALLALHEGLVARQVASLLGISRQTVYNWISAYEGVGPDLDLADAPRPGRPSLCTQELQRFIDETMTQSPIQLGYLSNHWTAKLLQTHLASKRQARLSKEALRRYLHVLGYEWDKSHYVRGSSLGIKTAVVA